MNLYLAGCLVLCAFLGRTDGCCSPDQWEGHVGEVGGVARRSMYRPPHLIANSMSLSYDATNKTMAFSFVKRDNLVRFVEDYTKQKVYIIWNTTCKYYNLRKPFKKACTDNYTSTGITTLGTGNETLATNNWAMQAGGLNLFATTTQDGCVPVGEVFFGKVGRDYLVFTLGYFNITAGIKDPSIFDHPDTCKPGKGHIDYDLESFGVSHGMKYVMNKFSGEERSPDKYLRFADETYSVNDI